MQQVFKIGYLLLNCEFVRVVDAWILNGAECKKHNSKMFWTSLTKQPLGGNCPKKKSIKSMELLCLSWNIWEARNNKVFKNINVSNKNS